MAVSSSVILSPLNFNFITNNKDINKNLSFLSANPLIFNISSKPTNINKGSSIVLCSYKSGSGLTAEDKRVLRERYGFDPNGYISETKNERIKEGKKQGKGKEVVAEEEAKVPRTTHKLLQVLGGKAKRKKLLSPKGMDVRPMMEVVKGAAFDILQAHFVEMDPWVVSNVLRPNLEWTGFLDASVIHPVRVETFLEQADRFAGNEPFDYISVTPPYTQVDYGMLMSQISKSPIVGEDTFIWNIL
ncbi:hypothetical protein E1A91_A07G243900v1 [Gossypium mustelinum]|uniref:Uncharacterized protein n=1 Tax=Gossypium mustelinum TaxID=34275 RepID=A0A5D2YP30_GOSMU|nr:hypothetical protein E1A91_A07G243900v1 [Gossypium mustelinum]